MIREFLARLGLGRKIRKITERFAVPVDPHKISIRNDDTVVRKKEEIDHGTEHVRVKMQQLYAMLDQELGDQPTK